MIRTLLVILLICVFGTLILSLPFVQTRLAAYATDTVNNKYGTNITVDKLKLSLLTWDTDLKGVYIEDYQKDTLFYIDKLTTSILSVKNLVNGKLEFGDIEADGLTFKLKTYKGRRDSNLEVFVDKLDSGKPRTPDKPHFFLSSSNVQILNSNFKLIDENLQRPEKLNFKDLKIAATDFTILGPEVNVNVQALSLQSKQGLVVEKLATEFRYTKQQMLFNFLSIKTPLSFLKGKLAFNYDRKDFKDFLNKVKVNASFNESIIALDEVNLLYNQFGKGKKVAFSSDVSGVLNDLNTTNLFLQSDNTGIRGDFNFKNLFTKAEPFLLNANIKNLTSSYYQLRGLLPEILGKTLPSSFQKLGQFTMRGDALITETSIDSKINLNTAIGNSYSDLQITNINDIDAASYRGFVSFIDFDLGELANDKKLGKTSLDFNVEGLGLVLETLNTEVIGEVHSMYYNGYEYKNLKVSGILKELLFDGSLVSNDDNLKLNFKGLADFSENQNNLNFIASVDYADLKKLNFISDSISIFKGDINMDVSGSSLDNIVGDIKFTKTNYQNKNDIYYFDDFKVSSIFDKDTIRTIAINSPDIITGYLKGKFRINELGKLVQNSIGSIYTNYRPFEISEGQRLAFNFKIYNKIVDVFFPKVKFGANTFIKGNIIADEGDFKLTFKSPNIKAFGNVLDNIDVKIDNKNPLFNTYVSIGNAATKYYEARDFNLINTTLKDTLFFRTEFKGGKKYNDSYNLNFYHTFNKDNKSVIGLKKSDINFKNNKWVLNKKGDNKNKVIFNKTLDSITIQEIVMNNEEEEQIRLRGTLIDSSYKDIQLQFKIVSLNKITPEIDSLKLDGRVNGSLHILQRDNVYLPSSNLEIADFAINNIRLGDLDMGIVGNKDLSDFVVNGQLTENNIERLGILGNVTMKNIKPIADLLVNFNGFNLEPFSPLGEGVISNIRGKINGSAQIKGEIGDPEINGLLALNNAGIGIPYLNVDYSFAPRSRVRLYDQTFSFEDIGLTDIAEKTKATLDGTISHKAFASWNLDLNVDTNENRFLILNTDYEEEALYYGQGFLNGTGKIYGSTKALNITVEGSTAKGTSLKIPISDVASIGDYSFINFIEKSDVKTIEEQRVLDDYQGLELAFDLAVTPEAEVEIVVDQNTKSSLKGTGEGILLIEINTRGKFNMYGEFVTVTGKYNHKFGGVIDKTFEVKPGGTVVWEGDPLAARLNMEAIYSLNANPAPLLDNNGYTKRIATDVVVQLEGELERPTIAFNIDFPGTSSIIKSELEYKLQDPTVEERNAFFLLAQGTFVDEESGINQQAVTGNLLQTASGLLNQVLGGENDKFDFGVSYEQGGANPSAEVQTENRLGVTVSTRISDRILINGKLGVPVGGVSETVVAGDVEVEVLLNEEGTLSAKIFNRENEIQQFLADNQGYTQGIGLSYEVDFNNFKELIRKIFRNKELEAQEPKEKSTISSMGKDGIIQFQSKN